MKKVVYTQYGNSDVLKFVKVKIPTIKKENSLLIKVAYSSLNAIDWKNRNGNFRFMTGILKPKVGQGFDVVGIVVNKSSDVNQFQINDKVVAQLGNLTGGGLSEYVLVSATVAVKLSNKISLLETAGLPMAGTTAWQALLKEGKLKKGDKVLINGGSGGVGHLAIQIAKAHGAKVTSISSSRNLEFCRNLGADHVISYQENDFLQLKDKFDIIFDVVFNSSFNKSKHLLKKNGIYIGTTPSFTMIKELVLFKQARFVAVQPSKSALSHLLSLMESGKLSVKTDRVFKLKDIIAAHNYIEKGRTRGKVIIEI